MVADTMTLGGVSLTPFDPNDWGDATWGSGSSFTWTYDTGANDMTLNFETDGSSTDINIDSPIDTRVRLTSSADTASAGYVATGAGTNPGGCNILGFGDNAVGNRAGISNASQARLECATNSTGTFLFGTGDSTPIAIEVNQVEVAHIAVDGSFGVGFGAPVAPLDVYVGNSALAFDGVVIRSDTEAVNSGTILRFIHDEAGNPDDQDYITADIRALVSSTPPAALESRLEFWVNGGDSMLEVVELENDRAWLLGPVGIGEVAPAAPLHVTALGSGAPTGSWVAGTVGIFQRNSVAGDSAIVQLLSGTTGTTRVLFGDSGDADAGGLVYNHANDSFQLYTDTGLAVSIDSSQVVTLPSLAGGGTTMVCTDNTGVLSNSGCSPTVAWDDITDPDAVMSWSFDDPETMLFNTAHDSASETFMTLYNTVDAPLNYPYLFALQTDEENGLPLHNVDNRHAFCGLLLEAQP
jgi:hypothetical protein